MVLVKGLRSRSIDLLQEEVKGVTTLKITEKTGKIVNASS